MATSVVLEVVQCQSAIAEYADSDWLIASWQLIWQLSLNRNELLAPDVTSAENLGWPDWESRFSY